MQNIAHAFIVGLLVLLGTSVTRADEGRTPTSAEDRARAASAYDDGNTAFLARNFSVAAQHFEAAYRLVPSAEALIQALRSHLRAGEQARAVTLAVHALERFPGDENTARYAQPAVQDLVDQFFRIEIRCEGCTVELDGQTQDILTVFVTPDEDHQIAAHYPNWIARRVVRGAAGEQTTIVYETPSGPGVVTPPSEVPLTSTEASSGWSPVVFWIGVGATAAITGVTIWSGVDTLSHAREYEAMPTDAGLDAGRSRELRTNVLIGAACALAVGTAAIGIFATDWSSDARVSASVAPLAEGGAFAVVSGVLP